MQWRINKRSVEAAAAESPERSINVPVEKLLRAANLRFSRTTPDDAPRHRCIIIRLPAPLLGFLTG
jgi:hypothetical protein